MQSRIRDRTLVPFLLLHWFGPASSNNNNRSSLLSSGFVSGGGTNRVSVGGGYGSRIRLRSSSSSLRWLSNQPVQILKIVLQTVGFGKGNDYMRNILATGPIYGIPRCYLYATVPGVRAKKFEDLVEPSADTEEKLKRLFEIPEKERASCSETIISEASFSSEFTPVMSSVPPPSSGKFSLAEVKARIMKKKQSEKPEKPEQDVIPNPLPVVATHSKSSVKKRKTPDSTTGFDSFDGLSVSEVKEKINSTLNLGYERILELMKEQEAELRETRANLKELLIEHRKLKDSHAQEIEKLLAQAGEEKKKIVEEAKESATNSVYQAMADMAKEAADHGFTLDHWDYLGLGESVKLKANVADPQETQAAPVDEGKSGDAGGECSKVAMGDDSENAKA